MKKLAILLVLFSQISFAQTKDRWASVTIGRSKHGTGDIGGIMQKVTYGEYFKRRLFWYASLGGDWHDGASSVFVTHPDGQTTDHSYRYTAGAVQLSGGAGVSFVKTPKTELGIRVAALLRYQSSSVYDALNIVFNPTEIGPYPAMFVTHVSPQRTFAVGANPEVFFQQVIFKGFTAGISGGFQFDTNGDVLSALAVSIGKRF